MKRSSRRRLLRLLCAAAVIYTTVVIYTTRRGWVQNLMTSPRPPKPGAESEIGTAASGCKLNAAFLYGGMVPPGEQLFRNNMEMLARPQLRAGCIKVDVFLVTTTALSQEGLRALRLHAAGAGAALVDTAHFEEDVAKSPVAAEIATKIQSSSAQRIDVHKRSSRHKVVLQNAMIKFKLERAEAYERKHGIAYNWLLHLRCDSFWYAPIPHLSALAPNVTHLPNFGRYGGVNDRFGIVPRVQRRAFFADRLDRWLRNDYKYACEPMCPCAAGICLEAHQCTQSHKYTVSNNECLLRTMLLDAHVPTREHRFNFSIVKNYRGAESLYSRIIEQERTRIAPCVVYSGECQYLGEHECRCLVNRCENTEQLDKESSDTLLLGAGKGAVPSGSVVTPFGVFILPGGNTGDTINRASVPNGTSAQDINMALSSFTTPLTPDDDTNCAYAKDDVTRRTTTLREHTELSAFGRLFHVPVPQDRTVSEWPRDWMPID